MGMQVNFTVVVLNIEEIDVSCDCLCCQECTYLGLSYFFVIKIIRVVFRFVCMFVLIKILFFTSCFWFASMTLTTTNNANTKILVSAVANEIVESKICVVA